MKTKDKVRTEGWRRQFNTRKWHYYRNGRSLCRRWLLISDADHQPSFRTFSYVVYHSPANCKACQRKREAEKAARDRATGN